jgi:hypothetical protein
MARLGNQWLDAQMLEQLMCVLQRQWILKLRTRMTGGFSFNREERFPLFYPHPYASFLIG